MPGNMEEVNVCTYWKTRLSEPTNKLLKFENTINFLVLPYHVKEIYNTEIVPLLVQVSHSNFQEETL